MDKIKWCFKKGMKIIDSNDNLAQSYLKMAQASFGTMNREKDKNIIFGVSAGYYTIYYSLYSILQKIGIKSDIHSCTIEFARRFLKEFYSEEDFELIDVAFASRNILQYYADRSVNKKDLDLIFGNAYEFFVKSRDILNSLNREEIKKIREVLNE